MASSDPNTPVPDMTFAAPHEISLMADAEGIILFAPPETAHWRVPNGRPLQGMSLFDLVAPEDEAVLRSWWHAFAGDGGRASAGTSLTLAGPDRRPHPAQSWRLPAPHPRLHPLR